MRRGDRSTLTVLAVAAWLTFAALAAAHRTSAPMPGSTLSAAAAVALGLALVAAARSALAVWRGPPLRTFPHDEAVVCAPGEAVAVRAAAQLRGSLGGAGHVHRGRLGLATIAWLSAAACALAVLVDAGHALAPLGAGATVVLGAVARLLPARPFYYREAMGGWIVVHPRHAAERLVTPVPLPEAEAGRGAAPAAMAAATPKPELAALEAKADGWGSSLTLPRTGAKRAPPTGDAPP
jgi:hypothetical protein